ncbi:LuxR C-terminal-related transcriptional regulator [Myroides sp. DF42-4-2]|uniref:response regulator transcription factor n=1 Tax=unclassified Myroides TaxID=2642485 RepID=UPI0025787544|nr:LuxR C-terminal-related transcriptional regulator [Myroides sp. DF42-4-2]MDM1406948.1 response regulator transcription factor [Myroides sp. DF42-4-2]
MPIHLSICESDSHFKNIIIESIKHTLNFDILDTYSNGYELVNRINYRQNNFLLIDIFTPIITGLEAIKILRKKNNNTPIITYSHVYQEDIHQTLVGYDQVYYCQKNCNAIFAILLAQLNGHEATYEQHIAEWKKSKMTYSTSNNTTLQSIYKLTFLELQIINYACQGLTNHEIGTIIHLSGRTVESHIKKLTEKFQVKNKIQLIAYCVEQNLHHYK